MRFYVVAQGIDGANNPNVVDGKLYELTAPQTSGGAPDPAKPGAKSVDVRVAANSDDAEESDSGNVRLSSSDLELVFDSSNQTVGIRFTGVTVPRGAKITNAYVQFQVDETGTDAASLTIAGVAADNVATFSSASKDISSRPRTSRSVSWVPPPWPTKGAAGRDQRTPNLASVIQEIVNRPGWSGGNALALVITGTGRRTADAYESGAGSAPLLHIELDG
jgi:hypothetical protein